jgi:hypothetical protein
MNRIKRTTHCLEAQSCLDGICLAVVQGERHKQDSFYLAERRSNLLLSVIEVTAAV